MGLDAGGPARRGGAGALLLRHYIFTHTRSAGPRQDLDRWADLYARSAYSQGVRRNDIYQALFGFAWFVGGLGVTSAYAKIGCTVIPGGSSETERQIDVMAKYGTTAVERHAVVHAPPRRDRGATRTPAHRKPGRPHPGRRRARRLPSRRPGPRSRRDGGRKFSMATGPWSSSRSPGNANIRLEATWRRTSRTRR